MVYYPLSALLAGSNVLVLATPDDAPQFKLLLGTVVMGVPSRSGAASSSPGVS